jgi:hypothetical protein|tara:strand:- start:451 stop:636 length:186 start_codon:yes stop_codon:yes gene_type:complete
MEDFCFPQFDPSEDAILNKETVDVEMKYLLKIQSCSRSLKSLKKELPTITEFDESEASDND